MTDLLSLVLTIRAIGKNGTEQPPPLWWGRAAHALMLKVVRQTDENLADALHENGSVLRPFTTSSLIGYNSRRGLDPERVYRLRLTSLSQEVTAHLHNATLEGGMLHPGSVIELDYVPFQILAIAPKSESELQGDPEHINSIPWTGQTTYPELSAPYLLAKVIPERQVTLEFSSPASWKSALGMHVPLPLPELVFGSLLNRWNEFAPVTFPEEVRRYAAECLAISHYRLSSRVIPLKRGSKRIGCVGGVSYVSINFDRYWMSVIQTLADFAFFAGVGVSTTQGMGQCRKTDDRSYFGSRKPIPGLGTSSGK